MFAGFSRRPVREENDFFNNKPQQHRRGPAKEIDLDRGEITETKRRFGIGLFQMMVGFTKVERTIENTRGRSMKRVKLKSIYQWIIDKFKLLMKKIFTDTPE